MHRYFRHVQARSPAQQALGPFVPMAACGAWPPFAHVRSRWGPAWAWARARPSCSAPATPRCPWQALRRALLPPPPHARVCQAGHPVLRAAAAAVDPALIASADVQRLIRTLVRVMRRLPCVGLSAPQLGVPLQLFVAELPERLHLATGPSLRAARQMAPFPLKVFVNPSMRVLDSRLVSFPEGCESIAGFAACVPRYQAVQVSGLNEAGDATSWQASGWAARILQHEMDHLQGILYIDKMESRTFVNTRWTELND